MSRHEEANEFAGSLRQPYVVLTVLVTTLIRELYISFTKSFVIVIRKSAGSGRLNGDAMQASQLGARLHDLPEVT